MTRKRFFMIISFFLFMGLTNPLLAEPVLTGRGAVLLDAESGQVLFEKNKDEKLHPASITKILTAIMAIESGKLNEMVTVSAIPPHIEGTRVYLEEGEKVLLRDLVIAALVHSANDAAIAIAEHLGGTEEKFAQLMNKRARELGAYKSNFVNAHGLSEDNHYTTAYDMAVITRYAMNNETFREIVKIKVAPWEGQAWQADLINKNKLLWSFQGADGVKTGYTTEAKCTIVASATREGQTYIAAVLGSPGNTTWTDAEKLLDYGFDNFQTVQLARHEEVLATIALDEKNELLLAADDQFSLSLPQAGNKKVESRLSLKPIGDSIDKGQVVGEMIYSVDGQDVGSVNLVAIEPIKVAMINWFDRVVYIIAGLYLLQILWRIIQRWRKSKKPKNIFMNSSKSFYRGL